MQPENVSRSLFSGALNSSSGVLTFHAVCLMAWCAILPRDESRNPVHRREPKDKIENLKELAKIPYYIHQCMVFQSLLFVVSCIESTSESQSLLGSL